MYVKIFTSCYPFSSLSIQLWFSVGTNTGCTLLFMMLSPCQISPPEPWFLTDRSQVFKVSKGTQVNILCYHPTLVKDLWKKSGFRIHLSFYNWPIWTKYAVSQILIRMSGVTPQQVSWCKYKQSASAQAEPNTEREMTSVSIHGPVSQRPYNPDCRQNGYARSGSENPYFKRELCLAILW